MQSRDFCYWLQGFFELSDQSDEITAKQAIIIKRHLDLVFAHELRPTSRDKPAPAPRTRPSPPVPDPAVPAPMPAPRPRPAVDPVPTPYPDREDSPPPVTNPPLC